MTFLTLQIYQLCVLLFDRFSDIIMCAEGGIDDDVSFLVKLPRYFQFQLIFSQQLLGIQLALFLHCALIHLLTSLSLELNRRTIDSPEILLAQLLIVEVLYRIESRPYLLLKTISLVFTDIPIQIEEPVRARIGFSRDK